MTDYEEEQRNELEALESIYPDELSVITMEPFPCFQLSITSQSEKEDEMANCVLQFAYTGTYPDEAPVMEILETDEMDDQLVSQLLDYMKEQAEENLGMVMVFTIVSGAQEKLTQLMEEAAQARQDEAERRIREIEEAERKKFEGTRVQVETFLAWKTKFDAEMAELKLQKGVKSKTGPKKLTGKELFMQDHTLDDSDVKFLEEEGDAVQVDESLFQEMEDFDLEDEDLS